jgi:hypothetical protein
VISDCAVTIIDGNCLLPCVVFDICDYRCLRKWARVRLLSPRVDIHPVEVSHVVVAVKGDAHIHGHRSNRSVELRRKLTTTPPLHAHAIP